MKKLVIIVAALLAAGCATKAPSIQQGADAEYTFDGLARVDNSRFKEAWADPDIDFTRYKKIMLATPEFEFRAVKKQSNTTFRSNEREYWISDNDKQKLIDIVSGEFNAELKKSTRFTIVDEPGPDVLIIAGGLQDIVSLVPPEQVGRNEIFLRSVGEATLVIEAKDSLSGETIYRAVDRRSAERAGGPMMRASSVTTIVEVRRLAQRWATRLREGLDSIQD